MNTLAKFTSNPGLVHWRTALRVLGLLNTTKHYCIRYAQQHFNENITSGGYMRGRLPITPDLQCYVDASHAADVDKRRSTTGYIFFISGGRKERKERKKKKEKKEKRNLSKKRKRHKTNNTAVKHWFPLSSYCLVLQFHEGELLVQGGGSAVVVACCR